MNASPLLADRCQIGRHHFADCGYLGEPEAGLIDQRHRAIRTVQCQPCPCAITPDCMDKRRRVVVRVDDHTNVPDPRDGGHDLVWRKPESEGMSRFCGDVRCLGVPRVDDARPIGRDLSPRNRGNTPVRSTYGLCLNAGPAPSIRNSAVRWRGWRQDVWMTGPGLATTGEHGEKFRRESSYGLAIPPHQPGPSDKLSCALSPSSRSRS